MCTLNPKAFIKKYIRS